jgi:hypothetical protein
MTGASVAKTKKIIGDEGFMLTYGNDDIDKLFAFHQSQGKVLTVTGVKTAVDEFLDEKNLDAMIYECSVPNTQYGHFIFLKRMA